jgi:hypothetical protein
MALQDYWTIGQCLYCKSLIPLALYDENRHYKLTDSFSLRHAEQVANSDCHALGHYDYSDLRRQDLGPIDGLKPNLSFASEIIPR